MQTKRPKAKTFRDLLVWRKAHEFVLGVYRFTATFPKTETYGLALQMRRAAVSIPANIAEGFARRQRRRQGPVLQYRCGLSRRESLLLDSEPGSWLRRHPNANGFFGGSEPAAERLHQSHSDSWLLTPGSHIPLAGYQGAKPLA